MYTIRGGLAHQRSCAPYATTASRSYRRRRPGKERAQDARQSSSTGGSPFADVRSGRESEIAYAGGGYPPGHGRRERSVPAAVVQPREPRSRRGLESVGHAGAKVRQRWRRFSASCTRILLRGIRGRTLERRFPGSSATTTVRRRRPPSGSTSSRVSFWAAFPGSSGCGGSSRSAATRSLSRRTRTGRTRSSSEKLPEAEIVISQPFWPAYLTAERIAKAPGLKLAVTAGIGSDHVDLEAAIERGITVAEITYSNSISVVRACRDDDPVAGAQLHPVLSVGRRGRLEHRRLRRAGHTTSKECKSGQSLPVGSVPLYSGG